MGRELMGDETRTLPRSPERTAAAEGLLPSRLHAGTETHAPWVWVNGGFVRSEDLRAHYLSHALHYGSGVFEGIRCYETPSGPAVFRLRDHMERLLASAKVYGLVVGCGAADLCAAALETVRRNGVTNGYIRPLAFYGEGTIHLTPQSRCPTEVLIAVRPLGAYLGNDGLARGVAVILSSWRKFDRTMLPPHVKGCGHYTNSILAAQEAAARGAAEAILLNADGTVAEATGENVFFVQDGSLVTNGDSSNILPGITRDTVLTLAAGLGIPTDIRAFRPEELFAADEVFMTGTAAEVTPVATLDDRPLRLPEDGITARLQRAYFDCVRGRDPLHAKWLAHA
ncbi:MAG: branched-chain amino acid transaminase [Acidobacteriota bacterium]